MWSGRPSPWPPWRARCFIGRSPWWSGGSPSGTLPIAGRTDRNHPMQATGRPRMRKLLGAAALAAALVGSTMAAEAADKLVLQLKWVTQAQFAGYYVAKDKGLYKEVGLDVEIKPGGPDINPSQVIAGG